MYLRGLLWRVVPLFVILDAVLCALKCIFVLIDNLLWHIGTVFFWYNTASPTLVYPWPGLQTFLFIFIFLRWILFFFPPSWQHISKYTTVLINKFLFKVVDCWKSRCFPYRHTRWMDSSVGCEIQHRYEKALFFPSQHWSDIQALLKNPTYI